MRLYMKIFEIDKFYNHDIIIIYFLNANHIKFIAIKN